jgi:hypothetical protein
MPTPLVYPTYTIGSWAANVLDDFGCQWGVSAGIDITNGPGRKTHITSRPYVTGAYRSRSFIDGKSVTMPGWVSCPDRLSMIAARSRLLALFPYGEQLPLVVNDGFTSRTLTVELADKPTVDTWQDGFGFDWHLSLYAADPRFLDSTIQNVTSVVGSAATDGLDWSTGGGLNWATGGGLNWGTSGNIGSLVLTNTGNAESWPTFTLVGPVGAPLLTDVATGRVIAFGDVVGLGHTLVISTSPFNRYVQLDGVDRFGSLVSGQWFPVPPSTTSTVIFSGGGTSGSCTASWQNANY